MTSKTPFQELGQYMDLLLDAICVVDKDHKFSYLSPGAKRVFGYEPEAMLGKSMFDFMHPEDRESTEKIAQSVNEGGEVTHFENRYIREDGEVVNLLWSARWSDRDQMRVGVARDITKQKELEIERVELIQRLSEMALTDPLTHLPNRALFYDRVRIAKARASREGYHLGILYLDLDCFKHINDDYGHATGDTVLLNVAQRFASAIRATDTVARLGGDEFVVLVDEVPSHETNFSSIRKVGEKILEAMQAPIKLPHGEEVITASIGLSLWPKHGDTIDALLNQADQAMYRAKKAGGNQVSS